MVRPPRELGKEAFSQAHSGRGRPAMSERVSRMALSKTVEASWTRVGGQVRRANAILGRARQYSGGGWSPFESLGDLQAWTGSPVPSARDGGLTLHSRGSNQWGNPVGRILLNTTTPGRIRYAIANPIRS